MRHSQSEPIYYSSVFMFSHTTILAPWLNYQFDSQQKDNESIRNRNNHHQKFIHMFEWNKEQNKGIEVRVLTTKEKKVLKPKWPNSNPNLKPRTPKRENPNDFDPTPNNENPHEPYCLQSISNNSNHPKSLDPNSRATNITFDKLWMCGLVVWHTFGLNNLNKRWFVL